MPPYTNQTSGFMVQGLKPGMSPEVFGSMPEAQQYAQQNWGANLPQNFISDLSQQRNVGNGYQTGGQPPSPYGSYQGPQMGPPLMAPNQPQLGPPLLGPGARPQPGPFGDMAAALVPQGYRSRGDEGTATPGALAARYKRQQNRNVGLPARPQRIQGPQMPRSPHPSSSSLYLAGGGNPILSPLVGRR